MNNQTSDVSQKSSKTNLDALTETAIKVRHYIAEGLHITRNRNKEFDETLTLGERLADRVASFGGSWPFIMIFGTILIVWVVLNSYLLVPRGDVFDPYPYILLNLFLSMLAAVQAPVILMSQNRYAAKDRLNAEHDYEVNLKAELEVKSLHDKLDLLTQQQWRELIEIQQEQIRLLMQLVRKKESLGPP